MLLSDTVTDLDIRVPRDDSELEDWRAVHNEIIPTDPLTLDQVRERSGRHRLEVAYLGSVAVGCSTVRPPEPDVPAATVIARVLPDYRRRGHGTVIYRRALDHARTLGVQDIETIVLATNTEGLAFAESRGFVEIEREVLPGDTIAYVLLRRGLQI